MQAVYEVKKLNKKGPFTVNVPGSKSITNRALMLAALSNQTCVLDGVLFSDDSRAFLDCLVRLGFDVCINESDKRVTIKGNGGEIPNRSARIDVRSAGTAARFLTVMLTFAGGDYELTSSEQMAKRPMQPLLSVLEQGGAQIEYHGETGHFPFALHAQGMKFDEIEIDTSVSSQFASALLMAATLLPDGLKVRLKGDRAAGSYIRMTLSMMRQFGLEAEERKDGSICVPGRQTFGLSRYVIEPDVSGAAYFYALAPLLGAEVLVRGVYKNSLQGDIHFIELLQDLGCTARETEEGLMLRGNANAVYPGIRVDMNDFSDQTMTMAALAVYAQGVTEIVNVGHIRAQESDRMAAILNELTRLGIRCEEMPKEEGLRIYPGEPKPATVDTYHDHRMAMAFSLIGLKADGVKIDNPGCCGKTFENFFEVLESLY